MSASPHVDGTDDVCLSVLEAVASCLDIDILDIDEPLQRTVDGDSLARLWGPKSRVEGVNGSLQFDFYGCRVTVTSDGRVEATQS